ncbi:MAG TPA: hypothetical protein VHD76_06570 [Bryobacteraceae bacterium]|jgi:hypothetical protein|nr:hypothetical protein [Bryobacteraceae bacterium]
MPQTPAKSSVGSSERRQRVRTLLAFVLLQGVLYCLSLNLLPASGEETFTLSLSSQNAVRILELLRGSIHAPLYFLLAHGWRALAGQDNPLTALRILSVIITVAATLSLDYRWLRKGSDTTRDWFLLLWTFSPCLLLFSRMAAPYSLAMCLAVLAASFARDYAGASWSGRRLGFLAGSLAALFYTQYVAGIAIWAGVSIFLLMRRTHRPEAPFWKAWVLPNVLVLAICLPALAGADWSRGASGGNPLFELGYWLYSFAFGESASVWLLSVTLLLGLPWLWLIFSGARWCGTWVWPALAVAAAGFAGVAQWNFYSSPAAGMLFTLPLFIAAAAAGIEFRQRAGLAFGILLFGAGAAGIWFYFGARDFLNPAYLAPDREIAASIVLHSNPAETMVWLDAAPDDSRAFEYYLPAVFRLRRVDSPGASEAARTEAESSPVHDVWFVRRLSANSDTNAAGKLANEMRTHWYNHTMRPYVPLSPAHKALLHWRAVLLRERRSDPPRYLYEVWKYERPMSDTARHSDGSSAP